MLSTLSRIDRRLQHAEQLLRNLHVSLLARRNILFVEDGTALLGALGETEWAAGQVQLSKRFEAMLAPAGWRVERLTEEADAACNESLDGEADARVALIKRSGGEARLEAVRDAMRGGLLDPSVTAAHEEALLDLFAMRLGERARKASEPTS